MTNRPNQGRRPYQRRSSYGAWIGLAVAAVLAVVAVVMIRQQEARTPPPTEAPVDDVEVQRRLAERAAEEKERQRQHSIRVLRQKLERVDRQIASNQKRLKDAYSWSRDRDLAEAKELDMERAQVVEELKRLGEEP